MSGALWYGPLLPGGAQLLAGASPDITLALSGQAATASAGTLGVAFGLSATGQAATASAGTLSLQAAIALAGSSGTTSAGTLLPTFSIALVGEAAAGSAGTLTVTAVSAGGGGDPGYSYADYSEQDVAIAERHREIMRLREQAETQQEAEQQSVELFLEEQEARDRARELVAKAIDRLPALEAAQQRGDTAAVAEQRQGLSTLLKQYESAQRLTFAGDLRAAEFQRAQRIEFERLVRVELERLAIEESEFMELLLLIEAT